MRFIRHAFLALISAAAFVAQAQEPTRLKFTLDWVIDGQQTPFFLTQGKGYFTRQGLNVTLDAGAGSTAALQWAQCVGHRVAYRSGHRDAATSTHALGDHKLQSV